jgi:hypothetical protein
LRKPALQRREPYVRRPGGRCRGNQFFSGLVRRCRVDLRVRRRGLGNVARCIPRGSRRRVRVRWAWVRGFRLRDRFVRAAVRELHPDGRGSATFRVA